jgi:hypothetical protein
MHKHRFKNLYKHNSLIFYGRSYFRTIFRKNLVCGANAARKQKIRVKQNKHKQLLRYLYFYRRSINHGVRNEHYFNTSCPPFNNTKPRLNGRIVGGIETDITSHPYQVWPLHCC